ncbi:hypothetical protein ACJO1P_03455 [Vibrio parahaemolyticus]|uniref:hypothetical protein n=1 Tax=Vibrio parahaemolyticus TaxID=670 RepID=UPI0026B2A107
MSNMLSKIKEIVDNAGSIVTSGNISNVASAATKVLLVAAVSASAIQSNNAFAHQDTHSHVHSTYASIAGESLLVRDHVQNTLDLTGISVDQHSDYLNYKHPVQSKINEFIEYAHSNYDSDRFQEVSELAEMAQTHFDNGIYEGIDQYATYLTPLLDNKVGLVEHHNSQADFSTKMERLQAVVDLVDMMDEDPNFDLDYNIGQLPRQYIDSNESHISIGTGNMNVIITAPLDRAEQINGFLNTALAMHDYDLSKLDHFREMSNNEFKDVMKEAYNLSDKDLGFIHNSTLAHEMAHLFGGNGKDMTTAEFMAESGATWNALKSGASEGYLNYVLDSKVSAFGVIDKQDSHESIALMSEFFSQYEIDNWRDMDINQFQSELYRFTQTVLDNTNNNFGEMAQVVANEKVRNNGIYPTAQEYLRQTGTHQEILEILEGAKEIAHTDLDVGLMAEKVKMSRDPNASFLDKLAIQYFPSLYSSGFEPEPDRDIKREMYMELAQKIPGSHGYFHSDFDLSQHETDFDKARDAILETEKVKIMDEYSLVKGDDGFTQKIYHSIEAKMEFLDNGNISYSFSPEYADYNNVVFEISPDGTYVKTVNGIPSELEENEISNIEHSGVESLAYALESFKAQEHANQVEHQHGDYSYSPDAERGVKIEQKDLSERGHRYEKSRDDYGYGM